MNTRQSPNYRRMLHAIIVALVLGALITGCGDSESEETTTTGAPTGDPAAGVAVTRHPGIDYTGTGSFNTMDVWAPTETGPWPGVIVVHGVADQSMSGFQPLAEEIASHGAVVYNIDVDSTIPWITAIEQVTCSVRYAREHGTDYGGAHPTVVVLGNSTGAAVASVVALGGEHFSGPCAATGTDARVDGFVGYEGDYDYLRTADYFLADHRYLADEDPDLYEAMDPYAHVGENPDLVVRLLHGEDDASMWYDIDPGVSEAFCTTLENAGYDAAMRTVPDSSHKDLMDASSAAFRAVVDTTLEVAGVS